jgi:hypothetical protein
MRRLTERDIVRMLSEEYRRKILEFDTSPFGDSDKPAVARGLEVRHKKTNLKYTVISVSLDDVVLQTPEGNPFAVTVDELEKDYKLD